MSNLPSLYVEKPAFFKFSGCKSKEDTAQVEKIIYQHFGDAYEEIVSGGGTFHVTAIYGNVDNISPEERMWKATADLKTLLTENSLSYINFSSGMIK